MSSRKKKCSVVTLLRDRECGNKYSSYFTSLKITSQLIRSDENSLYSNIWKKSSPKEIAYDSGNLYFSNYKQYYPINLSYNRPPPFYKMEQKQGRKRITDVISYSGISVYKDIDNICQCDKAQRCICLSQYLLSISEDNWLCQHSVLNGKLMKQIYVNLVGHNIKFKYCDWDMYGERFILTSTRNPFSYKYSREKNDAVACLAVFTTFPVEFYALLEIKRSVFGDNVTSVSISNQSLITGLGSAYVAIYNFDDFLRQGALIPYRLGDLYENKGEVGSHPTGLPMNFTYSAAPPVLFKIKCLGQIVRFGGYPYHFITINPNKLSEFQISALGTETPVSNDIVIEHSIIHDPVDTVVFHPDQSNRIIYKSDKSMDVYKIITGKGNTKITKLFSMGQLYESSNNAVYQTSYGRTLKPRDFLMELPSYCILCSDYEDELEIFAVLAKYINRDYAYVILYDNVSGEELRRILLKGNFCDSKIYQIYIDLYAIIVIERDLALDYTVHVCIM